MRTTVTLDDDVAAAIDRLRRERGVGVSEAVNELVRSGLSESGKPGRRRSFRQRTARLGLKVDVSNVAEVLEVLDEPRRR